MQHYPDSNIYRYENRNFIGRFGGTNIMVLLNNTFELIEEEQEIDIQDINEMLNPNQWTANDLDIQNIVRNINELTRAVKQLDNKIKGGKE